MKKLMVVVCVLAACLNAIAQQEDPEADQVSTQPLEEERRGDQLALLQKKIHLNTDEDLEAWVAAGLISQSQRLSLRLFRKQIGDITNPYELQAVPGWDTGLIHRLWPLLEVLAPQANINEAIRAGRQQVLWRVSLPKQPRDSSQLGSGVAMLYRYRFNAGGLKWGVQLEKDAFEKGLPFVLGGSSQLAAYAGFHFKGRIRELLLGQYIVNMGQGLVCWQGYALARGSDIVAIEKHSEVLKGSSGNAEYGFNRGAGICAALTRAWRLYVFAGLTPVTVTPVKNDPGKFSGVKTDGYFRTGTELSKHANMQIQNLGGCLRFQQAAFECGINVMQAHLSRSLAKSAEPYRLWRPEGRDFMNASVDFSGNIKGIHGFGEVACDRGRHGAAILGLLLAPAGQIDLGLQLRWLPPAYFSWYGAALSDMSEPSNEQGLFLHANLRPAKGWGLSISYNQARHPWLRYQVNAPAIREEWQSKLSRDFSKTVHLIFKFRERRNDMGDDIKGGLIEAVQFNFTCQFSCEWANGMELKLRTDHTWILGNGENEGWLQTAGLRGKLAHNISCNSELSFYKTSSYSSRVYGYRQIVQGMSGFFPFWGMGFAINSMLSFKLFKTFSCSVAWQCGKQVDNTSSYFLVNSIDSDQKFQNLLHFQFMYVF